MTMRFNKLSIGAAMFAGAVLALSAGAAQADDHWDHRYDHYDRYHHDHYAHEYVRERPVVVHERAPVIVERERPVYMAAPPVVYPMAPQGPSGLNLNFNIPLN
jgi:hypothetical protein